MSAAALSAASVSTAAVSAATLPAARNAADEASMSAITPTPIPTTLGLVPAASSPIKFPAPASDADFNTKAPVTATGSSTGTNQLTITAASGPLGTGQKITGTGVPAGLHLTSQISGPPGGNGVYTTNVVSTLSAVALTFTSPEPIDPAGNVPPIVVNPATVIPGEPLTKTNAGHDYVLQLPTFAFMPLVQGVKFNLSQVPPFIGAAYPQRPTPPPTLTMTRTPPFPAYPT